MNPETFTELHGSDWRKFAGKPMFAALLKVIDEQSPARSLPKEPGDRLHGAAVYLNEIYGWEKLRSMLVQLADTPETQFEAPVTFAEHEKF